MAGGQAKQRHALTIGRADAPDRRFDVETRMLGAQRIEGSHMFAEIEAGRVPSIRRRERGIERFVEPVFASGGHHPAARECRSE